MAITDKEKGVWGLDEVYNKINQGGIWEYTSPEDGIFVWGTNQYGQLGLSQPTSSNASSPIQLPGTTTWDHVVATRRNAFARNIL